VIARWIAGETQAQIAKSLGYADGSNVSTDGMFVIHDLPKEAYKKYGPPAMHTARLSVRKVSEIGVGCLRATLNCIGINMRFLRAWGRSDTYAGGRV